jgi:chitin disaccharide deacetylase
LHPYPELPTLLNPMKIHRLPALALLFLLLFSSAGFASEIRLLIRGDDMGSTRAANLACIQAYRSGILTTVEVMPVGPWFLEAASMLQQHPELDVGIHLALTSEWSGLKWRPLTHARSLMDKDGYFFPMVWPNANLPKGSSISEQEWDIDELERELRAQIEVSLRHIPHITHLTTHMGFDSLDPRIRERVGALAKEYGLGYEPGYGDLKRFPGWQNAKTLKEKEATFVRNLEMLEPGLYQWVEHPAYDTPEMQGVSHPGNDTVGLEREHVTRILVSELVKKAIESKGIQLVSFKDLQAE